MSSRLFYFILIPAILLAACDADSPSSTATMPVDTWFSITIDGVPLEVQVVVSLAEQQKGLMYRESLIPGGGMVFPYRDPQQLSFWMANTSIPLDLGFFNGEGVLLEIHRLIPFDTRPVRSRTQVAQFAIETNSGWYAANGLLPGSRIDMKSMAEALRSRGAKPAEYGIPLD